MLTVSGQPKIVISRAWFWLLLSALPAIALAGVHKHVKHKHWTTKYDHYFKKYSKHYFGPQKDWHWFKAQAIAESGLDPKAKSKAGAIGIMQIMPATFNDIKKKQPLITSLSEPKWNIAAGIYYDRLLYKKWMKTNLPAGQRLAFSFASYNAGHRKVRKAYNKAENKDGTVYAWGQVAPYTPSATRHYVKRISGLMKTE